MVDKRARKVLFDTYWSSAGWVDRSERMTTPADLAHAIAEGLMFEPRVISHAEAIQIAMRARSELEPRQVADAFVASLTSRRLDWRSGLGSYALVRHMPPHDFEERDGTKACAICGAYADHGAPEDLSLLSFARHKWGGVGHAKVIYAGFDLEQLLAHPADDPSDDDVASLRSLLSAIREAPPGLSSARLEKELKSVFKSNKAERDIVVGILGMCGVLESEGHPSYFEDFVPSSDRELPSRRFVDMEYPACWWESSHGLNEESVAFWFGHLL